MNLTGGVALFVEEVVPRLHGGCLSHRDTNLAQNGRIKTLSLHAHRNLVDTRHILALDHTFKVYITERRHLHAQGIVEVALCSQDEDIGLDSHALQFFYAVLGGFGL